MLISYCDTHNCFSELELPPQGGIFGYEESNFVILDDVGEELEFYKDRLVLTSMFTGLTKERAELAIRMLNEGEEINE